MCVLAFAWQAHPRYPLIFVGNRDEFHARPAAAAHWWPDATHVFGGRDLEAGGTWLGVRRDGRFAVVTNFREPDRRPPGLRTRGELPVQFLAGNMAPAGYLRQLRATAGDYAGYNLLFGDTSNGNRALFYFSNRGGEAAPLAPGVHALSNHLLDTPWPKVRRLREKFTVEAARDKPRVAALLDMLDDATPAPPAELPDTGIAPEWERLLSAPKVVSATYGTRASTVVLIDDAGAITFHERRFMADGKIETDSHANFGPANPSGTMPE